jgi:hypothetical protein
MVPGERAIPSKTVLRREIQVTAFHRRTSAPASRVTL